MTPFNVILGSLFFCLMGSIVVGFNIVTAYVVLAGLILYLLVKDRMHYFYALSRDKYDDEWVRGIKDCTYKAVLPDGHEVTYPERVVDHEAPIGDLVVALSMLHAVPAMQRDPLWSVRESRIRNALNNINVSWTAPVYAYGENPKILRKEKA